MRCLWIIPFVMALLTASEATGQQPNVYVWFEAVSLNPNSSTVQQGMQGGDLDLACDTSAGPVACEWNLSMMMNWDPGPLTGVVSSMATDFLGDTAIHSVSNLSVGNYPLDGYNFVAVNAGGVLADTRAVQVPVIGNPPMFEVIPPGVYELLSVRLTTQLAPEAGGSTWIDMRINSLLWTLTYDPAGPIGQQALVQFGGAAPVSGIIEGALAKDVITILNVPEPTALALLAMTSFLSLRRTRRR